MSLDYLPSFSQSFGTVSDLSGSDCEQAQQNWDGLHLWCLLRTNLLCLPGKGFLSLAGPERVPGLFLGMSSGHLVSARGEESDCWPL